MGTSRNLEVAGCAEGGNVVGRDRREMVFLLPSGSRAWDQCRATLRRSYEGRSATVARGGQDELDLACNLQVLAKAGPRLRHPRPCGTCGEEASETSCSGPQGRGRPPQPGQSLSSSPGGAPSIAAAARHHARDATRSLAALGLTPA